MISLAYLVKNVVEYATIDVNPTPSILEYNSDYITLYMHHHHDRFDYLVNVGSVAQAKYVIRIKLHSKPSSFKNPDDFYLQAPLIELYQFDEDKLTFHRVKTNDGMLRSLAEDILERNYDDTTPGNVSFIKNIKNLFINRMANGFINGTLNEDWELLILYIRTINSVLRNRKRQIDFGALHFATNYSIVLNVINDEEFNNFVKYSTNETSAMLIGHDNYCNVYKIEGNPVIDGIFSKISTPNLVLSLGDIVMYKAYLAIYIKCLMWVLKTPGRFNPDELMDSSVSDMEMVKSFIVKFLAVEKDNNKIFSISKKYNEMLSKPLRETKR